MEIIIAIIFFIIFWMMSFFFSGMETGFISFDRLKLENDSKYDIHKKRIFDFTKKPEKFLGVTLVGNNIALVLVSIIFSVIISNFIKIHSRHITTIILSIFMLITAEIIPKSLFRENSNRLVIKFFPVTMFFYYILKPLIGIVSIIDFISFRLLKIDRNNRYQFLTREDLALILADKSVKKNFNQPQKDMLEDALEFNTLIAKNVMIPRTDIVAVSYDMSIDSVIELAKTEGYTRFPVYKGDFDSIIGILIIYDLIKKDDYAGLTANDLKRDALFVPETMDVSSLLAEMQIKRRSMAIVVDSYGGTSGLLTIEDILEEIVGEIEDEYDMEQEQEQEIKVIDDNTLIVLGTVEIDVLNEKFYADLPVGEYETVAGLIIDKLAKIPVKGYVINMSNWKFEILQTTNTKIVSVKMTRIKKEPH